MSAPAPAASPDAASPTTAPVTPQVRQLRIALLALVASFLVESGMYAVEVFAGTGASRGYAVNSVAKDMLFTALAVVAIADLQRRLHLVAFIVFGHAVIVLTLFAAWISGTTETAFPPPRWLDDAIGLDLPADMRMVTWLVIATAVTAAMGFFYVRARRAAAGLTSLSAFEAETIAALAEVTLEAPAMTPEQIAKAVDSRWAAFPADHKNRLRSAYWVVALLPLLWGRAPLPWMDPVRRRELVEKHLLPAIAHRSELGPLRMVLQASVRFVTQMIYMGYYGDERSYGETHYKRFSERSHEPAAIAQLKRRGVDRAGPPELETLSPGDVGEAELGAEVVVIGSGAGGSVVAAELVDRGFDVLLLDRGPYVPRNEITEDEATMYARLYSDGALQLSTDFTFQVLQGMCIGGGTVVNNGICFDLPDRVLAEWNGPERRAGLPDLAPSLRAVRRMISVTRQEGVPLSTGVQTIVTPRVGRGGAERDPWKLVEANLRDCMGCGNCNIGCAYGCKLSMIETVLPYAQAPARNGSAKGQLRILPLCRADQIEMQGGRAMRVSCVLRTQKPRAISVRIGKTLVVAAGAVHSSRLLMASGLGGDRVGRNLSANLASFMTGVFEKPQNAFDGLQLTHYIWSHDPDDHVLETFFNPVMSQALVMPGWLGEHQRNMKRYDHLMCVGALVRSEHDPANRVRPRRHPITGAEFDFRPSDADVTRLVKGLKAAGERLFDRGATEVMPATFGYEVFEAGGELPRLTDVIKDASDLGARTAHPQGGNAISECRHLGVVDPNFKVFETDNVHVCDASVFPTAITVNPQLTVMALAHLAGSERIAVNGSRRAPRQQP